MFENNLNPEQKIEKYTLWKFARTLNNSKLYLFLKRKRKEINIMNGKKLKLRRKKRRLRKKNKQTNKQTTNKRTNKRTNKQTKIK